MSIAADALALLTRDGFFERPDDLLCPADPGRIAVACEHSFRISKQILSANSLDPDEIEDVISVLRVRGACCDCEVLYNVAKESRLMAAHWKARHSMS